MHHALRNRINVARGLQPADLVIKGGKVFNVFTGSIAEGDIAIADGIIAGIGEYGGAQQIDARGLFALPGFIEGHIHIESSMLTPQEFARAVAPHGTTTVVADPHEICNVAGLAGMQYMLSAAKAACIDILFMAPSCVPATHLETSGAELNAADIAQMLDWDGVLGLAEMMNFPGVVNADEEVLAKLAAAADRVIDGHAPGLSGADLQAYIAAGPRSDHECVTLAEAQEKLELGMHVMIREGSAAKNLAELAPLLSSPGAGRCLLVSDDRNPEDLVNLGHLDHSLRRTAEEGAPTLAAIRAVTLNPATYFGLHDRGAIAPGLRADLALVRDLESFDLAMTLKDGQIIARDGIAVGAEPSETEGMATWPRSHLGSNDDRWDRQLACPVPTHHGSSGSIRARVIGIVPGQIVTEGLTETLPMRDGKVMADPERDILKLAVIERHGVRGSIGVGFVKGLGLTKGAIASTVAHDSHNLLVAGCDDESMLGAAKEVARMGGGEVVWSEGQVLAGLPLPVGGLMSTGPAEAVAEAHRALRESAAQLGSALDDPFMQLSFLALPVIPDLKLTDLGLVDVPGFSFVPICLDG